MNFIYIVINIISIIVIIILLYFTTEPFTLYDQLSSVVYDDIIENTNEELNKNETRKIFNIAEHSDNIYKDSGFVTIDYLDNTITLKTSNITKTFNIDKDKEKVILLLSTAKLLNE